MKRHLTPLLAILLPTVCTLAQVEPVAFKDAPHSYWALEPQDRFQKFMAEVRAGRAVLDSADERTFMQSMLKGLRISDSSQMLVFSATSMQSGIVNPRSPRAIYFNEDTSVGYIPGGRLEVASFDPQGGMMFYIFDRLRSTSVPQFTRQKSCTNCHTDPMSSGRPGFVISSVAVWWDGSSQETYRHDELGHHVPLADRFGGWHLTGTFKMERTHANLVGNLTPQGFKGEKNETGDHADLSRYPRRTSDILAQLVHEHQCGFTNRVTAAIYDYRERPGDEAWIKKTAQDLAAYVLFQKEAALPAGLAGDQDFIRDFHAAAPQSPLRQFDLRTRLFKTRLSYMVETPVWQALPLAVRREAEAELSRACGEYPSPAGHHLSPEERNIMRPILAALAEKTKAAANQFPVPSGAGPQNTKQTERKQTP